MHVEQDSRDRGPSGELGWGDARESWPISYPKDLFGSVPVRCVLVTVSLQESHEKLQLSLTWRTRHGDTICRLEAPAIIPVKLEQPLGEDAGGLDEIRIVQ